jgi:hypothetical protein
VENICREKQAVSKRESIEQKRGKERNQNPKSLLKSNYSQARSEDIQEVIEVNDQENL